MGDHPSLLASSPRSWSNQMDKRIYSSEASNKTRFAKIPQDQLATKAEVFRGAMEKESDIVRAACDYLAAKGYLFWRNNNVPIFDPVRKIFRAMPKYTMKGLPDIIVIKDGFFIGLEGKRKGKKQSPEQKEFERRCKEEGGEYYVFNSIEDLIEVGL